MKIFFSLTMLALAFAHQDDEHKAAAAFGDDEQRELQTCTCSTPVEEIDNYGFTYNDELSSDSFYMDRLLRSSSDDAEEDAVGGLVSTISPDLDLDDQYVGVRFPNIPVPQGSTIVSATLEFTADTDSPPSSVSYVIKGQDSDDAGTFTTTDFDISSRPMTTAQVNWPNVPAWTGGIEYPTPDLSPILQAIVNRAGWSKGNAVVLIITRSAGTGERGAESYDGDPSRAPRLIIEYRALGGTLDPSIFKRNGNTARLITASGYPNYNWKIQGYPQGSEGSVAILPGIKYPLPYDGTSYPEKLIIYIKVAASAEWLAVNSRAKFQYRLYDCPGDCRPTAWTRVINFDGDGTNIPPEEGSTEDLDENAGFFERELDLTSRFRCTNNSWEQIEFRIVNMKAANKGDNDKFFFVRQFYMNIEQCS